MIKSKPKSSQFRPQVLSYIKNMNVWPLYWSGYGFGCYNQGQNKNGWNKVKVLLLSKSHTEMEQDSIALILWPSDIKSWLTGKNPFARKGEKERRGQKKMRELKHHRLNGFELEQTPGDNEGQGSLVFCNPWGHKEADVT